MVFSYPGLKIGEKDDLNHPEKKDIKIIVWAAF